MTVSNFHHASVIDQVLIDCNVEVDFADFSCGSKLVLSIEPPLSNDYCIASSCIFLEFFLIDYCEARHSKGNVGYRISSC